MLLSYREMGWFAPAQHSHALELAFERLGRLLLKDWGLRAAVEVFGPVLPSLLEICYALVYAIPAFAVAMLYVYGRRERTDALLFNFLLGILMCYALFPYFLSEPPRTVFPGQKCDPGRNPWQRDRSVYRQVDRRRTGREAGGRERPAARHHHYRGAENSHGLASPRPV